jgi:polyisoprenoid-binding protein YceI
VPDVAAGPGRAGQTEHGGGERAAFRATAELRRADFGIRFNQILEAGVALVGESLRVELEIQAVQGGELPET